MQHPFAFAGAATYEADEEGILSVDVSGFVLEGSAAYIVNTVTEVSEI